MICNKKKRNKTCIKPWCFSSVIVFFYSDEEMKHEENEQMRFRILIR